MRVPWRVSWPAVAALLVGLAVTGVLSWVAYDVNDRNEDRLLHLQTNEAGAVLQVVVPVIETPLSSAAQIAATSRATQPFAKYISGFIGAQGPFAGVSLWEVSGSTARMMYSQGVAPALARSSADAATFLGVAARKPMLQVTGPLTVTSDDIRLGYAFSAPGTPAFVVYAESKLPPQRRAPVAAASGFADLDFALYLGTDRKLGQLIETNVDDLPLRGRTAVVSVPFGGSALTLVTRPARPLGGGLTNALWWIAAIVGSVMTISAAATAERLVRRRRSAERLTTEIQDLLAQQRTIASALQNALLPGEIPAIDGVEIAVRYLPGEVGVDIGGDWYDVVVLDARRFFFVIGDVSGRGVEAASVMASLRFAIRGFVSEGHAPDAVLDSLERMIAGNGTEDVATVLCGVVDVAARQVTIANAGHMPPLVIGPSGAEYADAPIGPPVGVGRAAVYRTGSLHVPLGGTLFCFTDGLVERRDEALDVGLERLQDAAASASGALEEFVTEVVREAGPEVHDDDIAVLAVRWRS